MALVGCFVTPHPAIIVPEVGGPHLREAEPTVRAMGEVRERAAALDPETIVLMSPHAQLMYRHMGVSLASSYRGSLAQFRAPNVRVEAAGDQEMGRAILEEAAGCGVPAAPSADEGDILDLDHGAVVPLVYAMGKLAKKPKLVLLGFSQLGLDQHIRFGEAVGRVLLDSPRRVLYVASGDMSHRLLPEGPYGFDPHGPQFDKAIADAFSAGDWTALTSVPGELATAAGECGFRSLLVLAGIVAAARARGLQTENDLLSYEGPFGVGYLVGEVVVSQKSDQQEAMQ